MKHIFNGTRSRGEGKNRRSFENVQEASKWCSRFVSKLSRSVTLSRKLDGSISVPENPFSATLSIRATDVDDVHGVPGLLFDTDNHVHVVRITTDTHGCTVLLKRSVRKNSSETLRYEYSTK